MPIKSITYLKQRFLTRSTPERQDYEDLIDTFLGKTGNSIIYGSSAPNNSQGLLNTSFIETIGTGRGNVWLRTASTNLDAGSSSDWTLQFNTIGLQGIKGDKGDKGDEGIPGVFEDAIARFNVSGYVAPAPGAIGIPGYSTPIYDPDGVFASSEYTAINAGTFRFVSNMSVGAGAIAVAGRYKYDLQVYKKEVAGSYVFHSKIATLDITGTSGAITSGINLVEGAFDMQLAMNEKIQIRVQADPTNPGTLTVGTSFFGSAIESVNIFSSSGAGGSEGSVQYNKLGVVSGDDGLKYNDVTKELTVAGNVNAASLIGEGSQITDLNIESTDGSILATNGASTDLSYKHNQDLLNVFSGTTNLTQTLSLVKSGGLWYVDVQAEGGGDLKVFMNGAEYVLDCTTGAGVDGKARSPALQLGAISAPYPNYIWCEISDGVAVLKRGPDVNQSDPVAILGVFTLLDDATTVADGPLFYQRTNNSSNHSPQFRGLIDEVAERVRIMGPQIWYGIQSTAVLQDLGGLTTVGLSVGAGVIFQLHRQNVAPYPVPNAYYVVNDPVTPFKKITNLNQITVDANGDSLFVNNRSWGLEFGVAVSSEGLGIRIYVSLPNGSYSSDQACIDDVSNTGGFNLPLEQTGGLVRISRMCLKYSTGGGGAITNILGGTNIQDRRNWPVGSAGGGGGSSSSAAGNTTEVQFNTGGILDAASNFTFDGSILRVPSIITTGTITGSSFIKVGGTATQLLLANGGSKDTTDFLASTLKGSINGLAELDGTGKVPSSQLPSYVDDVLDYVNLAAFPVTGETSKIYIANDTNKTYRWSGAVYVEISASLALGETSATAYRGDRGKLAYDHTLLSNNPHSVTKAQVGLGNVENVAVSTLYLPLVGGTLTGDLSVIKNVTGVTGTYVPTSYASVRSVGSDAAIEVISNNAGTWGSVITLKDVDATSRTLNDSWAFSRKTFASGSDLVLSYGTDGNVTSNSIKFTFSKDGNLVATGSGTFGGVLQVSSDGIKISGNTYNQFAKYTYEARPSIVGSGSEDTMTISSVGTSANQVNVKLIRNNGLYIDRNLYVEQNQTVGGNQYITGTSRVNGATNFGRVATLPTGLLSGDKAYLTTGTTGWYTYNGSAWVKDSGEGVYLPLTGGTLTGALNLPTISSASLTISVGSLGMSSSSSQFSLNTDGTLTSDFIESKGKLLAGTMVNITTAITSATASNNSFFRDSARSNKLSYKGIAGAVTVIEA